MMHIGLCKLTAHGLIKIRSIVHIICLRVFQLRKRPAEFIKLRFKGSVHLLQESVCDLFYRILLTACHRRNKYVKRVVHLLESGRDHLLKVIRQFHRKILCHLSHDRRLVFLCGNHDIHGFCLCRRHHIGVELAKKILQSLGHGRVLALHTVAVYNRKRNSVNGREERNLDTVYKSGNRSCHRLIIGRFKVLKAPHKSYECSKDTKAGKNIRRHLKKTLMYMIIQILFIEIFFNIAQAFLALVDTVCKVVHLPVQISVMENTFQAYDLLSFRLAWLLKQSHQFLACVPQRFGQIIHPVHPSEKADKINHNHNCQENEIIDKNADDSLAHI